MYKTGLKSFTTTVLIALTAGLFALPDSARAGSIVSWGNDGTNQVSDTPAGGDFSVIACGSSHSLALRADGSIVSWGDDSEGQISNTPAETGFTAIACGSNHSLALRANGSIAAWGNDNRGQVSDTPAESGFTAIAGGITHSVALRADGSIVSWGKDNLGQVSDTPTETGFTAIASSSNHSLALLGPPSPHFLDPIPADGSTVLASVNQLQWTLPETGPDGGVVTCVVYFGTDPTVENNPKVVDPHQLVELVSVTLEADTTYYWALDLYDSGSSTPDVPYLLCPIFTFTAVDNFAPIVDAGDDISTWLDNGERVVYLDGSASGDGLIQALSYEWTVTAEPNELNPATFDDATLPNAAVTVRETGTYTLQLEAGDGEFTVTDTMQIVLYADSCEHARDQAGFVWLAGDINHDCKVDFLDVADLGTSWLEENYSTE